MLWYIAAGSALGGVARYLASGAAQRPTGTAFPVGTLLVNLSGSFLLGLLLRAGLSVVLSLGATALGFLVARRALAVPAGLDPGAGCTS